MNAAGVRTIIETSVSDADIETCIGLAGALMADTFDAGDLGAATDTEIRRLLSAHFVSTLRDPEAGSLTEIGVDGVRVKLAGAAAGSFGRGLHGTRHGQTAVMLDPTGKLADLASGKPSAEINVIETADLPKTWAK